MDCSGREDVGKVGVYLVKVGCRGLREKVSHMAV